MAYSNPIETKNFRHGLRKDATPCERILWHYLKNRQIEGLKFRQQHGYGPYVMDFYCPELRWCIEVDGEAHDTDNQQAKDQDRTDFLNQHGIQVMRVRNEDIENNTPAVIQHIHEQATTLAAERKIELPVRRDTKRNKPTP